MKNIYFLVRYIGAGTLVFLALSALLVGDKAAEIFDFFYLYVPEGEIEFFKEISFWFIWIYIENKDDFVK